MHVFITGETGGDVASGGHVEARPDFHLIHRGVSGPGRFGTLLSVNFSHIIIYSYK